MNPPSRLRSLPVAQVLERLHRQARGDRYRFLRLAPAFVVGALRGKRFQEIVTVDAARKIYMPISREQGELLYLIARSIGAAPRQRGRSDGWTMRISNCESKGSRMSTP